jgi:5,6-dimethylbenzimidazole synthase
MPLPAPAQATVNAPAPPLFDAGTRASLIALLRWRRDVRRFRRDPLPEGTLERLVATAAFAPSVGLSQPWRFVSVEAPERRVAVRANFATCNAVALHAQASERQQLYAQLKLAGLDDAPAHLAVFADRTTLQGHGLGRHTMPEMVDYSAVIAIHTLWLVARAEGIGVGWVSILDPVALAATLDVPAAWSFIGYLCIGYPCAESDTPELEQADWERRREAAATLLRR